MKIKLFKKLLWLLALSIGLMSCKKNETPKPNDVPNQGDTYPNITEGKVFLPVLTHRPDIGEVLKVEAKRNGKFEKVIRDKKIYGHFCNIYEFSYTGMDIAKASYIIRKADGALVKVVFENIKEGDASKIKDLAKKNGFDDSHICAKRESGRLAIDGAEGLFCLSYYDLDKTFSFWQYGRESLDAPALSALPHSVFINARIGQNYSEIKSFETGRGSTVSREDKVKSGPHKGKVMYVLFKINATVVPPNSLIGYSFNWDEDAPADKLGKCRVFGCFFKETSYFYYRDDIWGALLPAENFLTQCKEEAYVWEADFLALDNDYKHITCDRFFNATTKIVLESYRKSFSDIYSGAECSAIYFRKR